MNKMKAKYSFMAFSPTTKKVTSWLPRFHEGELKPSAFISEDGEEQYSQGTIEYTVLTVDFNTVFPEFKKGIQKPKKKKR